MFESGAGVQGVDLTVVPGEVHALVGLNGAGKSTLMRIALGMLRPTAGIVEIDGTDISRAASTTWASVGQLVEVPFTYPELTARDSLGLAARLHGIAREEIADVVARVLDELALEPFADRRTRRLSLGNRQRLGLASALQHHPRLIVLDEPTNALDPSGVILLREALLRRAGEDGAGILVSSHHLDEVARIAHRITVLNGGRVIGTLDPHGVDIERAFFELVHEDDRHRSAEAAVRGGRPVRRSA
nr:ABC transporter ATP-binding protein [Actinopolymorpha pittospori]